MSASEQLDQLGKALATAQAEMKNAKLNKVNPHFKSKYADLAEIRDTVTPALTKNGIAVVQGTDATDKGLIVFTRLIHASGQWIESRFPIPYDKPQTMGSGITYGRRYTLSAVCNIAADEDDDGNAANKMNITPHEDAPQNSGPQLLKRDEARKLYKELQAELVTLETISEVSKWEKSRLLDIQKLGDWRTYIDKEIAAHLDYIQTAREAAE